MVYCIQFQNWPQYYGASGNGYCSQCTSTTISIQIDLTYFLQLGHPLLQAPQVPHQLSLQVHQEAAHTVGHHLQPLLPLLGPVIHGQQLTLCVTG